MPDNQDMRDEANRLLGVALPTELVMASNGLHEIYLTLRKGGFTEFQGLWIIGYIISGGNRPPEERGGKGD